MGKGKGNWAKRGTGKKYTINGETMTIPEFARKYNLDCATIRWRITHGKKDNEILQPIGEMRWQRKLNISDKERAHNNSLSWTQSALECYEIGGICKKCSMPVDIQQRCKMRDVIKRIVRIYGKPYDRENNFLED